MEKGRQRPQGIRDPHTCRHIFGGSLTHGKESPPKLMRSLFLVCGITNAVDGSQDDEIHCFKDSPTGRSLLKESRASYENKVFTKVTEEEEVEDIANNSDDSIELEF